MKINVKIFHFYFYNLLTNFYFDLILQRDKMLIKMKIVFEVLLLALRTSSIDSNNFCKLTEKKCSQRINAPFIYQCGAGICTRKPTECKIYLKVKKDVQDFQIKAAIQIALMSRITNYNQTRLLEKLTKLRSKIRNCSKSVNKWQSSGLCIRAEKEQSIYLIDSIFFSQVKNQMSKQYVIHLRRSKPLLFNK